MLEVVNDIRRRDGHPPLEPSTTLHQAARAVIGRVFTEDDVEREISIPALEEQLKADGYTPRLIVLAYASFSGSPADLFERWPREDPETFARFAQEELQHFALVEGAVDGVPTYLAVGAVSLDAAYAPQLERLDDIGAVRLAVLRATNEARGALGRAPLTFDKALEIAAQRHAEDMIDRDYFAHVSPEGVDVLERAEAAGYRVRFVAENLASGQLSVDEVVDGWLKSPGHRRNLLSPQARELGVGFALERDAQGGYEVVWVQVFGSES